MRDLVLIAMAALPACGSEGGPSIDAALADAGPGAIDLANASWELEAVHESAARSSDPQVAFDSGGRPMVVWAEANSAIGFSVRDETGWRTEMVPADAPFDPHLLPAGDGAHIVFTASPPATGPDIFYVRWDGAALSQPVNLTGPQQTAADFDASPAVVELADGSLSVFYYTEPPDVSGERSLTRLSFSDPANPGAPTQVLPPARNCGEIQAVTTEGGTVHLLTKCIPDLGDFEIVYLNDATGDFATQVLDPGPSRNLLAPDLALSADGRVHVVFRGTVDCGPDLCTDIFYSANLAPARAVTETPDEDWEEPAIILDGEDRIVTVFHSRDPEQLYWSFLDDGGFFRPRFVNDAASAGSSDSQVSSGATDPNGVPWIAFEHSAGDEPPDIWVAHMVP